METKFFVVNDDNYEKTLPDFGIRIPANGRTEIPEDFAKILIRQFEVRKITFEKGEETENVSYKEFLEKSIEIKTAEKEEVKQQEKKVVKSKK